MADPKLLPGKFVWFELVTKDPKRAQAFYGEVVGWKLKSSPVGGESYDTICVGDRMVGGYLEAKGDEPSRWLSYVSVEDLDESARVVRENGGKVLVAPHDMADVGRATHVEDPQGAELHLFRTTKSDPPDSEGTQGLIFWNELHTSDAEKAVAFYEKVVGYSHQTLNASPGNMYRILESEGKGRAGVTDHMGDAARPHWLPYVYVDDPDAALARAEKNGGKLRTKPIEIPGVGRFGVVEDPTGAIIALMKPEPRSQ